MYQQFSDEERKAKSKFCCNAYVNMVNYYLTCLESLLRNDKTKMFNSDITALRLMFPIKLELYAYMRHSFMLCSGNTSYRALNKNGRLIWNKCGTPIEEYIVDLEL